MNNIAHRFGIPLCIAAAFLAFGSWQSAVIAFASWQLGAVLPRMPPLQLAEFFIWFFAIVLAASIS